MNDNQMKVAITGAIVFGVIVTVSLLTFKSIKINSNVDNHREVIENITVEKGGFFEEINNNEVSD